MNTYWKDIPSYTWPKHSPDSRECRSFIGRWEATWQTRWELIGGKYYPKQRMQPVSKPSGAEPIL